MSQAPEKTPAQQLATPAQFLKGVGPQRAELLEKLGLRTAADLLFFFPRDYQDMTRLCGIDELKEGELVSITGKVEEVDLRDTGPGRSMLGVLIRQENKFLRAVWFNQAFLRAKFAAGQKVMLSGPAKFRGLRWEMSHPRVQWLDEADDAAMGRIMPVYPLTEGISQLQMRRVIEHVVESHASLLDEAFPVDLLDRHNLWPISAALPQIHHPSSVGDLEQARRRFIFQELFLLQLALALRRRRLTVDAKAMPLPTSGLIDARILRLFPFEPTDDQRRTIHEIAHDMGQSVPMNRLLQGDVGSGKTVVALYAMLLAVAHRHQAVMMAPTEILARQHAQTLSRMLAHSPVKVTLLTGGLKAAQRRETLAAIEAGQADVVVGTQAIVQAEVKFAKLGLAVIDEQHKFGVRQRALLRQSGLDPHYLVMTATPIPRTVTMTMFGDLDVSTLHQLPAGRQTVHTYQGGDEQREKWWEFVRKKLREGRQAFVIAPLVQQAGADPDRGDSDEVDFSTEELAPNVASAEKMLETLANGELEAFRLDIVHGRMTPDEKEQVMDRFRRAEIDVLVATSVVEVGIDIPNATIMTIEDAQRFGLAQLHQLRGRVSRGIHPGYVCAFADTTRDDAKRRIEAFVSTTDGFKLAELDLQLRGPGDLFGTKQHGLPPLRMANLARDAAVLEEARASAQQIVDADPKLQLSEHALLRKQMNSRYGEAMELGDVG